jgi:serine/threonine protein kinase
MQEIREIDILSKVDHPNIVRSLGHGYLSMAHAKEQGADIYLWRKPFIVLEHITGGNLQDKILNAFDLPPLDGLGYILRRQVLPVKKAVRIAKEMAEALMYLHEYYAHSTIPVKIIHRDMKPENIMLDESGKARLIDFSLAKVVPVNHNDSLGAENHLHEMYKGTSDIGMVRYMAPEVYRGEPYNEKVKVAEITVISI